MKYLLVIVVVWVAIMLWRQGRRSSIDAQRPAAKPGADTLPKPQPMARCAHCGLHLPATDAIAGRLGSYCSAGHRQAAEP